MKVTSGGTPNTRKPEYYGGNIPWLKTQEVDFNRIYRTETFISEEGLNNSSAKWIPANSVIVAMYGATAGRIAINKIPLTTNQACCNLIIDPEKADYRYIYYNLLSRFDSIANMAVGGAQQNLNAGMIKDLPIDLPDLPTQKAIAEILSSLDDKIELNNQINQNLEALAQALFKQWFVDFEFPNENGEPYKSSGGEMVDSELGEIPKGWKMERLGDHLYIKGRIGWKGLKISEYLNEFQGYSIINGSDFSNEQIDYLKCGWIPKDRYDDSPEIQLKERDILITKDGTIGKLAFVNKIQNPTSVASGIFVVRPQSESVKTYFLWSFFKSFYFKNLVKSRIDGSVIPHLYQKDFVEMFIPLPPQDLLNEFENQAKSIFTTIFENKEESSLIGKLRDTLLPKLISGELEVSQVEQEAHG
jgi:type I restriction enzyme S subunit